MTENFQYASTNAEEVLNAFLKNEDRTNMVNEFLSYLNYND